VQVRSHRLGLQKYREKRDFARTPEPIGGRARLAKGLRMPLQRRHSWEEVKAFSRALAQHLVRSDSGRFTASLSRQQRTGMIFIDYPRNTRGATAVAAFSTRALAGAPVSTPVAWEELTEDLRDSRFNVHNVPDRLKRLRKDPWADYWSTHQ
jgi:bifunctional non-homologous end joining protein LigD